MFKDLKELLKLREARETGICLKREDLYNQCFDELIRQITINCSHRGLLLVRIRDELKLNVEYYRNLYESVLSYGIRKAMIGEKNKNEMKKEIKSLSEELINIENEVKNLEREIKDIEINYEQQKDIEIKKHEEEINAIKKKNLKLKEILEKKLKGEN